MIAWATKQDNDGYHNGRRRNTFSSSFHTYAISFFDIGYIYGKTSWMLKDVSTIAPPIHIQKTQKHERPPPTVTRSFQIQRGESEAPLPTTHPYSRLVLILRSSDRERLEHTSPPVRSCIPPRSGWPHLPGT